MGETPTTTRMTGSTIRFERSRKEKASSVSLDCNRIIFGPGIRTNCVLGRFDQVEQVVADIVQVVRLV